MRKTSVVMPSGTELAHLGDESRCMECHQGRESTVSVNTALSKAGVTDDDQMKLTLWGDDIKAVNVA